jgi:hypothetical protein
MRHIADRVETALLDVYVRGFAWPLLSWTMGRATRSRARRS